MTTERYLALEANPELPLTGDELAAGWHRCPDWDFLLIGPGARFESERDCCLCRHPSGRRIREL